MKSTKPADATQAKKLRIVPVSRAEANDFVEEHHRHHGRLPGDKFCIGAANTMNRFVGVAIVGRPVARHYDDGWSLEVTRVCVLEGHPNANSMLYGACWRVTKGLGYRRLYTYTRTDESGGSLRGAGWRILAERPARSWEKSSVSRPRVQKTEPFQRILWEAQ